MSIYDKDNYAIKKIGIKVTSDTFYQNVIPTAAYRFNYIDTYYVN